MPGGFMGKFLWVDLTSGSIRAEVPDEALLRDFIGGYGIGARLLYSRMPARSDALGPDNILGIVTGPLTGSPAPTATRYTVLGKSPLTHTWGDANASGFFGPRLKMAGVDAVFFTGISPRPVLLLVEGGEARLVDASDLWGKDTYETDDLLKARYGKDSESTCIGPAGEKLSLISGVVGAKGRTAARSGLGAVMGAKRIKGVVAIGDIPLPLADPEACKALKRKYTKQILDGTGFANFYRETGTPGTIVPSALNGDSPVKNWAGVGVLDFPEEKAERIGFHAFVEQGHKKVRACWRCAVACWGEVMGEWQGEAVHVHVPEYETSSAFGSNLLMDNLNALLKSNDLCNRYGLDTISTGATVAFAIECYQNGLLTRADTGGLELAWGDADTIVTLVKKMARREGIGDLLADGTRLAARRIGQGAEKYAIQIGGQELPMHDPRFEPAMGVIYKADATPGRHVQASQYCPPEGLDNGMPEFGIRREEQKGRGRYVKPLACLTHVVNSSGFCLFGFLSMRVEALGDWLTAVTGYPYDLHRVLECGERIANIRQAFNVREGYNLVAEKIPERAYGIPPLQEGPLKGITVEIETMLQEYLDEMGWTQDAAVPRREVLERLGLKDVADDLWS